jgi:hypothetical protein
LVREGRALERADLLQSSRSFTDAGCCPAAFAITPAGAINGVAYLLDGTPPPAGTMCLADHGSDESVSSA